MPHTATMTLRLPPGTIARLNGLAKATDRSKAYLAGRAIEEYLAVQEWQIRAIQEAVSLADSPHATFLDQDDVVKKARKFGAKSKVRRKR